MENVNSNEPKGLKVVSHYKLGVKLLFIGIIVLLLLIPTAMVSSLIRDRENTASVAESEVFNQWGGSQTILPPMLEVNRQVKVAATANDRSERCPVDDPNRAVMKWETLSILPNEVSIEGDVETKELKRGIYEIVTMAAPITIKGNFLISESDKAVASLYNCSQATVSLGISDLKGISSEVILKIGDQTLSLTPNGKGLANTSQLSAKIDIQDWTPETKVPFELTMMLKGSTSLNFIPLAKTTSVKLTSNCVTPSFCGSFLPTHREVTEKGFHSDWSVSYLNRSYPQLFTGSSYDRQIEDSEFGVKLLIPVQHYQKTMRCVKYAILFIILTFALFFFIETIQKKSLHPIQYTLVGLALTLFYVLLLSFSEHIGFTPAYAISSLMLIVMMTLYTAAILKIKKTACYIGAALAGLYLYIFVLIQMETYALLAGSLGLFAILSAMMYFSQKINWEREE